MKKKNTSRTIGSCLVVTGLVLLLVFVIGMVSFGNASPDDFTVNDDTRLKAAENAERAASVARSVINNPLNSLISYYEGKGYTDAAQPFKELRDALASGTVTDEMNSRIQGIREAAACRAAIGTDQGVAAAGRRAALARVSPTAWLLMILGALLVIGAGFYLNHGYGMRQALSKVLLYLILIIGAVIMVFPFYWMLSSSLKSRQEVSLFPPAFAPSHWLNFENYRLAANTAPFARYFINSLVVCFFSVLIVTCTTILAAFAFSRLKFPGRELIFSALLSMMMLPFEMLIITNYSTVISLGFNDSLPALVFPFISSIFYTYIMRNFFMSIPDSLYWSARVDGCSNWRYLWKVMVPIARPSLVTVVLLNALASWNSFMWPLLVIKSTNNRTLPFGLYAFTTEAGSYQELIMAAATIVVLPMIILFLFCRKQILNGVARGGIKG